MVDSSVNLFLNHENKNIFRSRNEQIAVTVLCGSLGSGKTTLLDHVMKNRSNLHIGVLINDLAATNVDSLTLSINESHRASAAHEDQAVGHPPSGPPKRARSGPDGHGHGHGHDHDHCDLSDGCVCCSLLPQFRDSLASQLKNAPDLSHICIETSGVSDPLPLMLSLNEKFGKMYRFRLHCVICCVDAPALFEELRARTAAAHDDDRPVCSVDPAVLACADVILLNKMDVFAERAPATTTGAAEVGAGGAPDDALLAYVRSVNERAQVLPCSLIRAPSEVPLSLILDVEELSYGSATTAGVLSHESAPSARTLVCRPQNDDDQEQKERSREPALGRAPRHSSLTPMAYVTQPVKSTRPLALAPFMAVLRTLPASVVRAKGWLRLQSDPPETHRSFSLSGCSHFSLSLPNRLLIDAMSTTAAVVARFAVSLSLIGTDPEHLKQVSDALLAATEGGADGSVDVAPGASSAEALVQLYNEKIKTNLNAPHDHVHDHEHGHGHDHDHDEHALRERATFEVLHGGDEPAVDQVCNVLRVSAAFTGIQEADLASFHSLSINDLNVALADCFNAQPSLECLVCPVWSLNADRKPSVGLAVPREHFGALFPRLARVAEVVVDRFLPRNLCRCQY